MRKMIFGAAVAVIGLSAPLAAQAQILQGTQNGAQQGAAQGSQDAGPIGGIVGGAIGAGVGAATGAVGTATGIVGGATGAIFGNGDEPRFHDYVTQHPMPSTAMSGDVQVGTILPRKVKLHPVPRDFHVNRGYRYAMVNDQTVIVDPRTRRVIEVME